MGERFFTLGRPRLHVAAGDASSFTDLYLRLSAARPGAAVRMIRGSKSRTRSAFFDEIGAALQFPDYFGENWDALNDCLTDLDWIEADAFLLMHADAQLLLSDEPEDELVTLLELLSHAGEEWLTPNRYFPRERSPTPFHAVFHCPAADEEAFVARLARFGEEFDLVATRDE